MTNPACAHPLNRRGSVERCVDCGTIIVDESEDEWPYPAEKMPEADTDSPRACGWCDGTGRATSLPKAGIAPDLSPQFLDQAAGIIAERAEWPCTRNDCNAVREYAAKLEQDLARLRAEKEQGC